MQDFSQEILDEAYQIGYREAQLNESLTIPAHSEELTELVKEVCQDMPVGASLPLYESFGAGQAAWFHEEAVRFCDEENGFM